MKILLIGGTGIISTSVCELMSIDHHVTCINRASKRLPQGVEQLTCDANDEAAVKAVMKDRCFDAIVDFVTFTPEQVEKRIRCFEGRCSQYVFISTATVYQKPPQRPVITEDTPTINPYSSYAQQKIRSEQAFRQSAMPVTIVRPFMTYGNTMIPFILRPRQMPFTLVDRLRKGKPILVPGDGTVFCTVTHAMDFARGLLGLLLNPASIGETVHITQDECRTWNDVAFMIAETAGAPEPRLVHVASDRLIEANIGMEADLYGDKAQCCIFDNSKIKALVPGFECKITLEEGLRQTIAYMDDCFHEVDEAWDAWCDDMISRFG